MAGGVGLMRRTSRQGQDHHHRRTSLDRARARDENGKARDLGARAGRDAASRSARLGSRRTTPTPRRPRRLRQDVENHGVWYLAGSSARGRRLASGRANRTPRRRTTGRSMKAAMTVRGRRRSASRGRRQFEPSQDGGGRSEISSKAATGRRRSHQATPTTPAAGSSSRQEAAARLERHLRAAARLEARPSRRRPAARQPPDATTAAEARRRSSTRARARYHVDLRRGGPPTRRRAADFVFSLRTVGLSRGEDASTRCSRGDPHPTLDRRFDTTERGSAAAGVGPRRAVASARMAEAREAKCPQGATLEDRPQGGARPAYPRRRPATPTSIEDDEVYQAKPATDDDSVRDR